MVWRLSSLIPSDRCFGFLEQGNDRRRILSLLVAYTANHLQYRSSILAFVDKNGVHLCEVSSKSLLPLLVPDGLLGEQKYGNQVSR
jgi:hypothetical protein